MMAVKVSLALALAACLAVANAGEVTTSRPFLIDSQVVDMQVSKGGAKWREIQGQGMPCHCITMVNATGDCRGPGGYIPPGPIVTERDRAIGDGQGPKGGTGFRSSLSAMAARGNAVPL